MENNKKQNPMNDINVLLTEFQNACNNWKEIHYNNIVKEDNITKKYSLKKIFFNYIKKIKMFF